MTKLIYGGLLALLASPALAGSLSPVVEQPAMVVTPAPVAPPVMNWAGAYAGATLGYGELGLDADLEELAADFIGDVEIDELPSLSLTDDGVAYGAHFGYNWQNQRTVFGVEMAVLGTEAELEIAAEGESFGAELDYAARLMGKVGYQFAEALFYGTAGVAYAEFGGTGDASGESEDETGYAYGVGMEYMLTQNISLGAEYVRHRFEDIGGLDDVDAEFATTSARMSYHF
ncbi:outer membrane beta-barrel protein [Limimaricola variabilis]|uniref:outer membrane protein n=1 Tax=Limimaricola variabilis TaxID=1492771 RepID=UPI002AC8D402|nr:outer membrane beta-barrel protein [Limimaricola variabilis]WPY95616.1 outer membrane beta-barrel protein [Limimaricola variabilis]